MIWILIELLFDGVAIYAAIYDIFSERSWILYAIVNVILGAWTLVFIKATVFTNNIALIITFGLLYSTQLLWNDLIDNSKL